jgi:hypothetical protein
VLVKKRRTAVFGGEDLRHAGASFKVWWYLPEMVSGSLAYLLMYFITASRSRTGCRSTLALHPSRTVMIEY